MATLDAITLILIRLQITLDAASLLEMLDAVSERTLIMIHGTILFHIIFICTSVRYCFDGKRFNLRRLQAKSKVQTGARRVPLC